MSAALEEFATSGFAVSARHIERVAEVERGLIGYHFGTKEDLWNEVVDEIFTMQLEELRSLKGALRDVSRRERARAFLMAHTRFNAKHPEAFRLFVLEGNIKSPRSERLGLHVKHSIELFRDVVGVEGPLDTQQAMFIYQIIGAAGTLFATTAYSDEIFGEDVLASDFIENFARILAAIGLGESIEAEAPGLAV
jgi:AcrR family transcriptional regulator